MLLEHFNEQIVFVNSDNRTMENEFIVDTGATRHMVKQDYTQLYAIENLSNPVRIRFADHTSMFARTQGNIRLLGKELSQVLKTPTNVNILLYRSLLMNMT